MKPIEILRLLPPWDKATPEDIIASPAWSIPCRMGETQCAIKVAEVALADTIDVSITFDGNQYVLSIADSPAFADLHRLWESRADLPESILLALIEKECGPLLQTIENVVRRELKVLGIAKERSGEALNMELQVEGGEAIRLALTLTPQLVKAFGQLVFVDVKHPSVQEASVSVVRELAAFTLSAADMMSVAPGDALVVPEIGTVPQRLVAEGRLLVDENGVAPYSDDGRLHVVESAPGSVSLGWLLDQAASPSPVPSTEPGEVKLVGGGRTIAVGKLGRLGGQPVMMIESKG